ncbi:6938_t:CDS:2, partial [Scutellospora calospora]
MPLLRNLRSQTIKDSRLADAARKQRSRRTQTLANKPPKTYKIALHFCEMATVVHHALEAPHICSYCNAKLFSGETEGICCIKGKIKLASTEPVASLKNLYTRCDDVGDEFRNNICAYNSVFAFISMGVKLDKKLANGENSVYTFRAQGGIYHTIGSLYPNDEIPKFLQLYIYDTEHEINNRLAIIPDLRENTLEIIKMVLDLFNPFVANFRSIAANITDNLHLLIKADHGLDQRTYNKPTASQVAAIWIEGHDPVGPMKRDLIVESKSRSLQYVSEMSGSYDPMQYPLFFLRGDYGWHPGILQNASQKKQYVVDNYVKIETERLNYLRFNQDKLRKELYQGLQDSYLSGITNTAEVRTRTVLPSSFT